MKANKSTIPSMIQQIQCFRYHKTINQQSLIFVDCFLLHQYDLVVNCTIQIFLGNFSTETQRKRKIDQFFLYIKKQKSSKYTIQHLQRFFIDIFIQFTFRFDCCCYKQNYRSISDIVQRQRIILRNGVEGEVLKCVCKIFTMLRACIYDNIFIYKYEIYLINCYYNGVKYSCFHSFFFKLFYRTFLSQTTSFVESKPDLMEILPFVKIDIFKFQCKRNGQLAASRKRHKGLATSSTELRDVYFFCRRECMCGDETEQNKINQQRSQEKCSKAGNRIGLVIWRYKFDCIFEILLEARRGMSQSEYSIDQEASEDDYDVDEIVRPKLRPFNRNKQVLIQRIHLLKTSTHGATLFRSMLTLERCHGEEQRLMNSNYNPSYNEPKAPQEKRQTRGKNNKLPSEIISLHLGNTEGAEEGVDNFGSQMEDEEGPREEDDEFSIFNIEIAQILWRRLRQNTYEEEYLLKFKGRSYLHTEWMTEDQINALGKNMKNKINRFNKAHNQRLAQGNYDQQAIEQGKYFDPTYLEVDRIINATEMFPVIHQKKANQIKGKWSESLMLVCSKLLNFTKGHIHYGVLFSQPVDPVRDNCPEYPKIITQPMDLGTVLNKIYLDIYKNYNEFWKDIGLVWKNCLKFNKEQTSDLHLLGLTLRQCSLFLYDQWFHLSQQRYQKLKTQMAHLYIESENPEKVQVMKAQNNQVANQEMKNEANQEKQQVKQGEIQNGAQMKEQLMKNQQEVGKSNKKSSQQDYENEESLEENQKQGSPKEQHNMQDDSSSKNKQKQENNQNQIEEQKDYLDMEEFYKRNILLTDKKIENIATKQDIQQLNPGTFNYNWLDQQENGQRFLQHSYDHIDLNDMRALDINVEINRLYMIKWKNLSYSQATWELQSVVSCPDKINEFKNVNKALGKQARTLMDSQRQKHKILVDIENNPKKRSKFSNAQIAQIKNRLYFYDVMTKKEPYQYKPDTPHIYKNYKILRSYQIQSLNWLIKSWYQKRNTILADQMGLGKTIQSIAFLYHLFTFQNVKGPFLIIAPLSTLEHWKRTVQEWTNMNCVLYYDQNGQPGRRSIQYYQWYHLNITMRGTTVPSELNKFQILITSYEVFLLDFNDTIMNIPFQFIIVDQAHRLKNKNAKILSALKRMPCKRVLLLTGTPIQNNTSELWSLLNYIHPEKFGSHEDFKKNFGDLSSKQQVEKLNRILKPYMLRRMKQDVQQSIPPLQETIIDVQMTNIQKTIYKALYEKNKDMLIKGLATNNTCNTNLNNLQIQLRKCCNHPFLIKQLEYDLLKNCSPDQRMDKLLSSSGKMVLVKKLLEKCKNQGKKVLIFSQFTHMLQLIQDFLKWKDYKYERIDGQIKAKERQAAIDRYNNPNKKRDVFLLSTKAGGVGINLTSANVVIIYDSDWNPQNDVQATARAHRIGQKSQVQVYRLITCNTYQTEMFQRATQKLGLDKAIFIGGHFKQAGQSTNQSKLSKNQMQTLLKKGILGFLQNGQQGNNAETFFEQNVDEIIQNNSRIAKYSLINGSCSFSKSRFISQNADNQLKINDPNFWNIVLKNVQSPTQLLLKKLKNKEFPQNLQGQKMLMLQASQQLTIIIENKLTRHGLNADDQINLTEFLTMVNSERTFHKFYRDLASSWLQQIYKPSRRFKRFTPDDLVIQSNKLAPKKAVNLRSNNEQADNIFADQDQQEQEDDASEERIRLDDAKKQELLKRLCSFCQKPKCTYYCMSFCKRSFHDECRKKVQEEGYQSYDNFNGKLEINQLTLDNQTLKEQIITSWTCQDCSNNLVACLVCKNKGLYYGAEYKKNKKGKKKQMQQSEQTANKNFKRKNQVTKCSTANCAKYFHPKCIEEYDTKKLFKYIDTNSLHFRCSLHYCNVCGISGDTMSIFQCVRCPKALHTRCMDKQKIVKLSKKQFICDAHFKNKKDLKKVSERFATPANTLKKFIKAQKIQAKKKESEESQSQKEKTEKIQPEIAHNYSTRRNRHNPDEIEPSPFQEEGRKIMPKPPKQKMATLTYEELGLVPIKDFDYKTYDKDWCRYCGSRYSSNFTQGPWGSKTLCTVHYISWKQNKTLNLNDYTQKPETPIDPLNDQQLKYLTNCAQKHPHLTYPQVIEYLENKRNNKKLLI